MSRSGRQIINTKKSAPLARRRNTVAIGSLIILAIVIVVAVALMNRVPQSATTATERSTLKVGDKAPDFSLATTNGPFQLAGSRAEPTFLEVFATWCPHCQREVAVLNPLYLQFKDRIHFVAVNGSPLASDETSPETQADVVDFQQKFHVAYPVAFDPNLDVAHAYLQDGFPTVVLIDKAGNVVALSSGEIPAKSLQTALTHLAAGKKQPDPALGLKS